MVTAIVELPDTTEFSVGALIKHLVDHPDSVTFKASIHPQPVRPFFKEFEDEKALKEALEAGELRGDDLWVLVRKHTDSLTGKVTQNRFVVIRRNIAFLTEV